MQNLTGKTAFVTGGASGIGYAMAQAFLGAGMKVVIADVDADALAAAESALHGSNTEILAVQLDVTDRAQYATVVAQVQQQFGNVHVLCNNAGVYRGGNLEHVTYEDWDWVMGVNVGGVVNGIQTLLASMRAHGEGGHIVNTASMAGISTSSGLGVYNTSKFAVVGLSEALRQDLDGANIGVSVLCPGMVRTRILDSERTRPQDYDVADISANAAASAQSDLMHTAMGAGIDATEVADVVLQGIKEDRFYLFPHPEMKAFAETRATEVVAAFGTPDPERVAAQERFMADLLNQ